MPADICGLADVVRVSTELELVDVVLAATHTPGVYPQPPL